MLEMRDFLVGMRARHDPQAGCQRARLGNDLTALEAVGNRHEKALRAAEIGRLQQARFDGVA